MQDSRFIYESVDAAKSYLTILVDLVDPEKHLHFMPLRFYLYGIYSAVFLYKVRASCLYPLSKVSDHGIGPLIRHDGSPRRSKSPRSSRPNH